MIDCIYSSFKHWVEKGAIYLIGDPHFGDKDRKYIDANWPAEEEQVARIKKKVGKNDTIVILGDVGDSSYMSLIKARKILVKGNHDKGNSIYKHDFDEIYDGPLFISDKILLSHEPIDLPFALNIHGHCHGGSFWSANSQGLINRINLASDVCGYEPRNLKDFIKDGCLKEIPTIHQFTIAAASGYTYIYTEEGGIEQCIII